MRDQTRSTESRHFDHETPTGPVVQITGWVPYFGGQVTDPQRTFGNAGGNAGPRRFAAGGYNAAYGRKCPHKRPSRSAWDWLSWVESGCGAVAVGRACLLPPLSSGGALVARPSSVSTSLS